MNNTNTYIQKLLESNPLREPVLRAAIQTLHLPKGSQGVDIGCGIGLQALLLVEAVGQTGHITGIDISPEFLSYAKNLVEQAGCGKQSTFQTGNMQALPIADHTLDWAWSVDCAGYPAGELLPVLKEISRVVKPGGKVALLAWSSQQLLPGYPLLEARLNATCSAYAPYYHNQPPETHFMRALSSFCEAGFINPTASTFIGEVQAPLTQDIRTSLISLFQMLWEEKRAEVSPGDWQEFRRLSDPDSPDFILNLIDYYAFFTYTMFQGIVPG